MNTPRENRMAALALFLAAAVTWGPAMAADSFSVVAARPFFDADRGESVSFSVAVPEPGTVTVALYDLGHRRVKTLLDGTRLAAGISTVTWRGDTDGGGRAGAGQAFVAAGTLVTASGQTLSWDPATRSGGETVPMSLLDCTYDPRAKLVRFAVRSPARVRIRAGVREGPLLRTILEWAPRLAGEFGEAWDGMDETGTIDLAARRDLSLVASAYTLPDGAVLTAGAVSESTGLLAPKAGDDRRAVAIRQKALQSKTAVDGHYLAAQAAESVPAFRVEFLDPKTNAAGLPVVGSRAALRVTLDEPTAGQMLQDRFEIVVHVDMKRVFEEEQGYNPYAVEFSTDGFAGGEHLLSVSVASLADRISTVSRKFAIER
ncbi:MAG: hypothetical protein HY303_19175 [Candidatus Wallbacteria bacterium]|nr:hypothetical protein [Candidatus Wallbacteria bacterium]